MFAGTLLLSNACLICFVKSDCGNAYIKKK
jgi:hypothetical protein